MICPHQIQVKNKHPTPSHPDSYIEVPCGKCVICQRNKQREWVFRIQCEETQSKSSLFITLTYDDKYLPYDNCKPTLSKRHCQLFFKQLRKKFKDSNLRYYLVGEYGSHTHRPHYHLILFNLPFKNVKDAQKIIEKFWKRGFVYVGSVTHGSIAYCAKYSIKIDTGHDSEFPVREFMLCSRRPALGSCYLDRYGDRHLKDVDRSVTYSRYPHGIPRLFKNKLNLRALEEGNFAYLYARYKETKLIKSLPQIEYEFRQEHPNEPYNPYRDEQHLIAEIRKRQEREKF